MNVLEVPIGSKEEVMSILTVAIHMISEAIDSGNDDFAKGAAGILMAYHDSLESGVRLPLPAGNLIDLLCDREQAAAH